MTNFINYDLEHPLMLAQFKNLGFTRQDVKGLPEDVKTTLSSGGLSSLILLNINQGKETYLLPAKLQIGINKSTNQPELLVYGVKKELENNFSLLNSQLNSLKEGQLLIIQLKNEPYLLQYDPQTKNILQLPLRELKLEDKINSVDKILDIELGKEQKERIKEGKPVTLTVGGEDVTIGVDLRSPNSFKQLKGDMKEWERQKAIDYDIAHPEYLGLVKTDENRWEYHLIQTKGMNAKELKETPAQVKSQGMKL